MIRGSNSLNSASVCLWKLIKSLMWNGLLQIKGSSELEPFEQKRSSWTNSLFNSSINLRQRSNNNIYESHLTWQFKDNFQPCSFPPAIQTALSLRWCTSKDGSKFKNWKILKSKRQLIISLDCFSKGKFIIKYFIKIEVKFTVADTLDGLVMGHPVECRHCFLLKFFFLI